MKTTGQNRWTPRRSRSLVRSCMSLCLLLATAWPARSSSQGTAEQRQACTSDVFRLCSSFIPNADDIAACLRERSSELSDACRQVIQVGITQCPALEGAIAFASAPQDRRIEQMPIPIMKFVVMNSMAPRSPAVCAVCSRPLEQAYLHDLSSSKHYCRTKLTQTDDGTRFAGSIATMNPYELAIAWPTLPPTSLSAVRQRVGRQSRLTLETHSI